MSVSGGLTYAESVPNRGRQRKTPCGGLPAQRRWGLRWIGGPGSPERAGGRAYEAIQRCGKPHIQWGICRTPGPRLRAGSAGGPPARSAGHGFETGADVEQFRVVRDRTHHKGTIGTRGFRNWSGSDSGLSGNRLTYEGKRSHHTEGRCEDLIRLPGALPPVPILWDVSAIKRWKQL